MKKTITKKQYLELEGIRQLSKRLNEELETLVLCVADITGEELDETNYGLASDFIFSPDETVKSHLKQLGITIK
jgi:hypothetical protein